MKTLTTCFCFLTLLVITTGARAEDPKDILVIASPSLGVSEVSVGELKDLFLKKRTRWRDGKKAIPVNAPSGSELRQQFRDKVLKMWAAKEEQYWTERKIRKGESEPPTFDNTLKAVFRLRGAVSYIFRRDYKQGVAKVLLVIPR